MDFSMGDGFDLDDDIVLEQKESNDNSNCNNSAIAGKGDLFGELLGESGVAERLKRIKERPERKPSAYNECNLTNPNNPYYKPELRKKKFNLTDIAYPFNLFEAVVESVAIYLRDVPWWISDSDLDNILGLAQCELPSGLYFKETKRNGVSKGVIFLEFDSVLQAKKAHALFNGFEIDGIKVTSRFTRPFHGQNPFEVYRAGAKVVNNVIVPINGTYGSNNANATVQLLTPHPYMKANANLPPPSGSPMDSYSPNGNEFSNNANSPYGTNTPVASSSNSIPIESPVAENNPLLSYNVNPLNSNASADPSANNQLATDARNDTESPIGDTETASEEALENKRAKALRNKQKKVMKIMGKFNLEATPDLLAATQAYQDAIESGTISSPTAFRSNERYGEREILKRTISNNSNNNSIDYQYEGGGDEKRVRFNLTTQSNSPLSGANSSPLPAPDVTGRPAIYITTRFKQQQQQQQQQSERNDYEDNGEGIMSRSENSMEYSTTSSSIASRSNLKIRTTFKKLDNSNPFTPAPEDDDQPEESPRVMMVDEGDGSSVAKPAKTKISISTYFTERRKESQ